MQFQSIVIRNPRMGFQARLSVGTPFKGHEVLSITKVDLAALAAAGIPAPKEILGTYHIVLKAPSGDEYEIANTQEVAGVVVCINLTKQQIDLVPGQLSRLAYNTNAAEFYSPV